MHRALEIAEVVQAIVQSLRPTFFPFLPQHYKFRRNLLNVALTCRTFSEPALDSLWYYMISLKPLFNILPNFQCLNPNKLMNALLWGSISKTDLRRVKKYASRIRHYRLTDDIISIFMYMHLLRACGHQYLLPNLAYLNATLTRHVDSANTSKTLFLISPALREVHIDAPAPITLPVLNSLQIHAPHVIVLEICTTTAALIGSHFISAICLFPHLQKVTIKVDEDDDDPEPSVDINFFTRFSSNQTLRQFSLIGKIKLFCSEANLLCGKVDFPALEEIELECRLTSIIPIATLLDYVTLPSLELLWIKLDVSVKPFKYIEARYWNQFFDLIGNVTTNSFKNLEISSYLFEQLDTWDSLWKDVDLTVSEFPNLDKLSLESFVIKTPILLSLHQSDIQKIIKSWPGLKKLDLTSCRPFELGFNVLIDIALGLPELYYLQLTLSMDLQALRVLDEIPLLDHGLAYLGLEISSNTKPPITEFVQHIDKIFPKLDEWNFDCSNYQNFHYKATPLLTMLQQARRYESQRGSLGR